MHRTHPIGASALLLLIVIATAPLAAQINFTDVATNLAYPLFVTHANDGSGRLFIIQQGGRIRIVEDGQLLGTDFLHLGPANEGGLGRVANPAFLGDERGLLGMAFHPDFATNGRFFVSYTQGTATNRPSVLSEFSVSAGDPNIADTTERIVFGPLTQPFQNHNGGMIAFGPDGYLYYSLGDGGSGGDPLGSGQNRATLLGNILRLDINVPGGNPAGYLIPSTNPFVGNAEGWQEEIYAWGMRNAWRFSFDRATGRLFVADVGQSEREEVNIVAAGGNYGWNVMEGFVCYPSGDTACVDTTLYELPIFDYSHAGGNCSISGGYVYRGAANPSWAGTYFCGDYCSGRIWQLTEQQGGSWTGEVLLDTSFRIVSFGEDEAGELYLVHMNTTTGRVMRMDAPVASSGVLAQ
jgi:glucose/arabinose dehydrogenase